MTHSTSRGILYAAVLLVGSCLLIRFLTGCGELERELAPEVMVFRSNLNEELGSLLEISIKEEACHLIEAKGFECNIPEQIHSIKFEWDHDRFNSIDYTLEFCLKRDCPPEIEVE